MGELQTKIQTYPSDDLVAKELSEFKKRIWEPLQKQMEAYDAGGDKVKSGKAKANFELVDAIYRRHLVMHEELKRTSEYCSLVLEMYEEQKISMVKDIKALKRFSDATKELKKHV